MKIQCIMQSCDTYDCDLNGSVQRRENDRSLKHQRDYEYET
jgi:hypothetical protein